jgi:ABC-type dipeptide/oligopeptide/nickel transport system permease subunit
MRSLIRDCATLPNERMTVVMWLLAIALAVVVAAAVRRSWKRMGAGGGPWGAAFARLGRDRAGMVALRFLIFIATVAIFARWLAPFDPNCQLDIIALASRPPSLSHPFGTDIYSRDVLSRLVYGARISLSVAFLAVLLSITVGTAYGAIAGYLGSRADAVMMRVIDALLSIPRILVLLAIFALWGRVSLGAIVLILGLTGWFSTSRLVRAQVLALKTEEMVVAARALGARHRRILWRHILPGVTSTVVVAATLGIGNVIILEAGMSFLGVGVQPPTASWGNIISDASSNVAGMWWMSVFPGLAIVLTVMAFNIIGDALRDALDPREIQAA